MGLAPEPNFAGLRVVSFESRRAEEMRRMIQRAGGEPTVAPSMREIPLEDQHEAFTFAEKLFAGKIDLIILTTGGGTLTLFDALKTRHSLPEIIAAFSRIPLIARGPKPVVALAQFNIRSALVVPEPNTWKDILSFIDDHKPVSGKQVALQEYGASNQELLDGLRQRGAAVLRVPVYRWALPENMEPLKQAIQTICQGNADVLLFTSATQADHVMQVASQTGTADAFKKALKRCVVASIGPVCSQALQRHGIAPDIEPSHPKMGTLLSETSRLSTELLAKKRK